MATATGKPKSHEQNQGATKGKPVHAAGIRRGRPSTFHSRISEGIAKTLAKFKEFVSLVDVAEVFGVTTQTVRQWVKAGLLPGVCIPAGYTDRKLYMATDKVVSAIQSQLPRTSA